MVLNIKIILCNNKFLYRNLINPEIQSCSALVANDSFDITASFNPSLLHDNVRASKHLVNLNRITRFVVLTVQELQPYRTSNSLNNISSLYKSLNNTSVSSVSNEDYEYNANSNIDNTVLSEIKKQTSKIASSRGRPKTHSPKTQNLPGGRQAQNCPYGITKVAFHASFS